MRVLYRLLLVMIFTLPAGLASARDLCGEIAYLLDSTGAQFEKLADGGATSTYGFKTTTSSYDLHGGYRCTVEDGAASTTLDCVADKSSKLYSGSIKSCMTARGASWTELGHSAAIESYTDSTTIVTAMFDGNGEIAKLGVVKEKPAQ